MTPNVLVIHCAGLTRDSESDSLAGLLRNFKLKLRPAGARAGSEPGLSPSEPTATEAEPLRRLTTSSGGRGGRGGGRRTVACQPAVVTVTGTVAA